MAGFFPATFAWFLLSWPIFIFFTHDTGHPWPQMSKVKVIMLCRRFDAFAHWQRKVAETPIGRKAVRGSVPIKGDLHQFQGHSGKIKDQRSPGRLTPWPTITVLNYCHKEWCTIAVGYVFCILQPGDSDPSCHKLQNRVGWPNWAILFVSTERIAGISTMWLEQITTALPLQDHQDHTCSHPRRCESQRCDYLNLR